MQLAHPPLYPETWLQDGRRDIEGVNAATLSLFLMTCSEPTATAILGGNSGNLA